MWQPNALPTEQQEMQQVTISNSAEFNKSVHFRRSGYAPRIRYCEFRHVEEEEGDVRLLLVGSPQEVKVTAQKNGE